MDVIDSTTSLVTSTLSDHSLHCQGQSARVKDPPLL